MPETHDPFSRFDPEVPVPLSASDIRRRGDRLRRRNAGLAAAAGVAVLALIAVPIAVTSSGGDGAIAPAVPVKTATDTPTPDPAPADLVTRIPDGFPLDADLPGTNEDGSPVTVDTEAQAGDFRLCENAGFAPGSPGPTDLAAVTYSGGEDYRDRMLSVWDDVAGARAGLESVRETLNGCADDRIVYTEEQSQWEGDSVVFSVQVAGPDGEPQGGPLFSLEIVQAVRVENALYLARNGGETGGAGAVTSGVERATVDSSAAVAETYSVFGGDTDPDALPPPTAPPTSAATPGGPAGAASEDLSSFPLTMDWPTGAEGPDDGITGPGTDLDPFGYAACGEQLELPATRGDLRARYSNPEDYRTRELLTFADAGGAVDFMARARDFYGSCPSEAGGDAGSTRRREARETGLAGESFAVVVSTSMDGQPAIGLEITQLIRLGRAVLIDTTSGEGIRSGAPDKIDAMSLDTANVVAEMCAFTEAGC